MSFVDALSNVTQLLPLGLQSGVTDISCLRRSRYLRPVSVALLFGKNFQIVKEAGKARLQSELQVVLSDHQHQHGHKQRQEAKGKAYRALATLFRAEVVTHQSVKGLSEGDGLNENKRKGEHLSSPRISIYFSEATLLISSKTAKV